MKGEGAVLLMMLRLLQLLPIYLEKSLSIQSKAVGRKALDRLVKD